MTKYTKAHFLLLIFTLAATTSILQAQETIIPVFAARVKTGNIGQKIETVGDVVPFFRVELHPETGGQIVKIFADIGDMVEEGQLLARINDEAQSARLKQAQASVTLAKAAIRMQKVMQQTVKSGLASAEAGAKALEAEISNISTTRNRLEELFKQGAISRQHLDDTIARHDSTLARLDAARADTQRARDAILSADMTLEMRKAELIQAEANLNAVAVLLKHTEVKAPFSGIITRRFADPGALGSPNMPLFSLEKLQPVKIIANIVERYANLIKAEETVATIRVDSLNEDFSAKIDKLHPVVDPKSRTVTIELVVPNENLKLRSGMFANVSLAIRSRVGVVVVSRDSIIKHNGSYFAYVIQNNHAIKRPVETGISEEDRVEIIRGLASEELIVAKGLEFIREGAKVSIIEEQNQP